MSVEIISRDGKVLSRSRNLAGLRRAARKYDVRIVTLNLMENGAGQLRVWWSPNVINDRYAAALCIVPFASFAVMCGFVARWRSVYEAESYIAGMARGKVGEAGAQAILRADEEDVVRPAWMQVLRPIRAERRGMG